VHRQLTRPADQRDCDPFGSCLLKAITDAIDTYVQGEQGQAWRR